MLILFVFNIANMAITSVFFLGKINPSLGGNMYGKVFL